MLSVEKLVAGRRYLMTYENKKQGEKKKFTARINWIEDRGEFWYIGYSPDTMDAVWGACKVKKEGKYNAVNVTFANL